MKNFINRLVFFTGWILSPLTFWNDAFVNIPIAYLAAALLFRVFHISFIALVLISYWISNVIGLAMMYVSGKNIMKSGEGSIRKLVELLVTMAVYSIILVALAKAGFLKPL